MFKEQIEEMQMQEEILAEEITELEEQIKKKKAEKSAIKKAKQSIEKLQKQLGEPKEDVNGQTAVS